MSKCKRNSLVYLENERGGAHVVLLALLAAVFLITVFIVGINYGLSVTSQTKYKSYLDVASKAAASRPNFDPEELAYGRLVWDSAKGTTDFYRYLRLNFKLDNGNAPLANSPLPAPPIVHSIEFLTSPTYPTVVNRTVTVYGGTADETTRNVQATIYGPSIVAIVEFRQDQIGTTRNEPIIIPSVASVRFR